MSLRIVRAMLFFGILLVAWELGATALHSDVLPKPSEVWAYLTHALTDGSLIGAMEVTFRRLLVGYLFGILLGVPLGLLMGSVRACRDTLGVLALGLQTLPSVCWVPLALLWFGQSEVAMIFVVIMGTVWSVAIATDSGVRSVPPIFLKAARTMGSRGLHTWVWVVLPASLPNIVGGMKQGWAFAWRSLMAAEIYVSVLTGFGLGHLLHYGRELFAMDQVIGIMLVVMTGGVVVDRLLFAPVERFLRRRWGLTAA